MATIIKYNNGQEASIRFTPMLMARLTRETGKTFGDMLRILNKVELIRNEQIATGKFSNESIISLASEVGFDDLAWLIFAGCAELESLSQAEEIAFNLDDSFYEVLGWLVVECTAFMSSKMLPKAQPKKAAGKGNPTRGKNLPKTPKPEAE